MGVRQDRRHRRGLRRVVVVVMVGLCGGRVGGVVVYRHGDEVGAGRAWSLGWGPCVWCRRVCPAMAAGVCT